MAKGKANVNIPMCLAGVLLCLTLISVHLTGGLYARYSTSGTGGDSARVAILQSGETVTMVTAQGHPGEVINKVSAIEVANFTGTGADQQVSEVALTCTLKAENVTGNIPLKLEFFQDEACTKAVEAFVFKPGVPETKNYYLKITWPAGESSGDYAFEIDAIRVTASAEQVD